MKESTKDALVATSSIASGALAIAATDSETKLGKVAKPMGWVTVAVGSILLLKTLFTKRKDAAILNDKSDTITR